MTQSSSFTSPGKPDRSGATDALAGSRLESNDAWISRQVEELASAWAQGQRLMVEEILGRHPGLDREDAIRLVYEEVCLRREAGEEVRTSQVVGRFPVWKDELEILLGCDRLLRPLGDLALFPEVGEELGPYRLLDELGRGASGRTYLASEPALADRLVALKVIPDDQEEHLSLARLQHTHIIPLFSEQSFPDRGLRALCMPYLGGMSLSRLLDALSKIPLPERRGRHILEVLDRNPPGSLAALATTEGPYRRYLEQASYVQSVCWIAACLTDALQEAHTHGLVHMDVKPSNVLISADGRPMLLDFHLSRRPVRSGDRVADRLGGTPGWMAPEQEKALDAVAQGRPITLSVDHRVDLYAMGLLLCEALGGPGVAARAAAGAGTAWHRDGPEVSPGLADIVGRCLARSASDRYRDAASLSGDIRRHPNDQPLRGVANRSLAERWRKWRRRQPGGLPRAAAWVLAVATTLLLSALVAAHHGRSLRELNGILENARRFRGMGQHAEAVRVLNGGLELATGVPGLGSLRQSLGAEFRLARRGQRADELHRLADLIRFRFGIALPEGEETASLLKDIRTIWEGRGLLLVPRAGLPGSDRDETIRSDLLELVLVWTDLSVRVAAPAQAEAARHEALGLLDEVAQACGVSPALLRQRRALSRSLGLADRNDEPDPPPRSAWEHYDLGRAYLRAREFHLASEEFKRSLDERPQDFWPNFYQGLCAYRLGEMNEALAAFRTCVALQPETAECRYNRGLAQEALGHSDEAFCDYSAALERDPRLSSAAVNRGILSYRSKQFEEAIADFRRALSSATDSPQVARVHYNLALAYRAQGNRVAAFQSAEAAVARGYRQAAQLRDSLLPAH